MSKDIRSFFKVKSKPETKPLISNDDEIIPESPEVRLTKKKQESRKRRILDDSSDEEISKHSKSKDNKKNSNSQRKTNSPKEIKKPMKQVAASEIFGTTPVKRTEPIVKKNKKHAKTETGIHSDDEFERSLLELDNAETGTDINKIKNSICVPESDGKSTLNGDTCVAIPEGSSVKSEITSDSNKFNGSNSSETINKDERSKPEKNEKKRDFSVFIDDTESINTQQTKDYNNHDVQNKKRKMDKSLNESAALDEERFEKKRMSAILYKNYLNRSGPKHLGSKVIPEGTPTCLKDCAILLTGVLDSFERDEIVAAIIKCGGTVKNSVSKKVTHVLVGEDAGPAKICKAKELGIKIINEDEFLELIKECSKALPENNDTKLETKTEKTKKGVNSERNKKKEKMDSAKFTKTTKEVSPDKTNNSEKPVNKKKYVDKPVTNEKLTNSEKIPEKVSSCSSLGSNNENLRVPPLTFDRPTDLQHLMWVDKYKPQTVKQIIGQHGDASNAKKLSNWLMRWYINRKEKIPKPSPWSKNDDGAYYKAALLSGPPGVGKTTTVTLVCKELGFDTVEFNASDTRNKTLIREQISELLTTTSLSGYAKGNIGKKAITKKHVLVMDEVDGMAGNEDRGGLQELISLIKITAVPIICMCNDRNSQKMRTLVNYCYDLKFSRPRVDQIKSAMMSVCFKEGIKIHPDALTQLILAANQDVRQTLNMLSMWSVNKKHLENDQVQKDIDSVKKDMKLGPWEAVRKVFTEDEQKKMSLNDKSDLFFYDYSLAPLFVQENYLQVMPHCPKNEILKRVSMAADSISMGDLIENRIRSKGSWNLLPMQAMYSSVIPGHAMSGHVAGQIQFPSWLGKNSRANKLARLVQEIHAHTRLSTSGSKSSIFLDYAKHLRDAIITPLVRDKVDGIANSLEVLQSYHLLRDDLDSLNELATWPGQRDPMILVDSKVKAAMTRSYNKEASALPYAPGNVKRSRGKVDTDNGNLVEDDIEQEEENFSDSDPENDMLIKKKKKPSSKDKETEGSKSIKSEKGKGKKSKTKS